MVLQRLRMGAWVVSWEAFGGLLEPWQGSLGPLGGSWEALGSLLEPLGPPWDALEASWEPLGSLLGAS